MVALAPFAITLGLMTAVGLVFLTFWERSVNRLSGLTAVYSVDLERAGMKVHSEQIIVGIAGGAASVWIFCVVFFKPQPWLAVALLVGLVIVGAYAFRSWLSAKVRRRCKAFNDQLEMVLRMMGSGLRVGLGLRQAIVLVTEEIPEPARGEFARVFAQTNVGVSLNDALDALVKRMPSEELSMMVDAIRVQTQTGGNLAKILDHLAGTIKGRRAVTRKIKTLTGEAVAGAWILGALPVIVSAFTMTTQPDMREAVLTTPIGHMGLTAASVCEVLALLWMRKLLTFEV